VDAPATKTDRLNAALAGRYRIEKHLGEGGMATVYLAEDLRHKRRVAIKLLKPELAAVLGADRFVQEITTTASLQHPHILPLFDSGTADGFLFYVMPYIQGETIRDKLNRETQFGVDEAVRITREVADALDYAHRNGVIHRDIKPENILLHDGRAMVMDFGIALAVSAAAGGRMTETGLSLGTPHYMSPEQATAEKEITPRSDVYSLASVCYEMLTGEPPHTAGSAQAVIMKIITDTARPVHELRKNVPGNVDAALAKALEKLPADRFESAKAFADALGNATYTHARGGGAAAVSGRSRTASFLAWGVAALAIVTAVAGWMRRPPEQPLRRFDLSLGAVTKANNMDVVISPDGSMLATTGIVGAELAIYVRRLGEDPEFRKLPGTESGAAPEFSPDNQWIVFTKTSDGSLVKVLATGGGAVTLVPRGKVQATFSHWGTDGQIVFTSATGIFRIASTGGEPVPIPKIAGRRPFLLPDGSGVLYGTAGQVELYDFKRDTSVVLIPGGRHAVYVPTGHILYATVDNGLLAVAFDLAQHRVLGAPVRVLERVGTHVDARGYSVSATGVLVQYDALGVGNLGGNRLLILDPGRGADTVRLPPGRRLFPRFSPDGRSLAMEAFAEGLARTDIYTLDMVTGTYTQLTFDGDNDRPVWSPDGKRIVFDKQNLGRGGEDLFVKPADNSAPERRVTTGASAGELAAAQWIDDRTVLFDAVVAGRSDDIFTVTTDSGSVPVPYLQSPFGEAEPTLSPDRKMLAYRSNEGGGAPQVWMRDFPAPRGKWNISRGPGTVPRWSPDGRYVYFWRGAPNPLPDTLFRVRVERTPGVVIHAPEMVAALNADGPQNWDLHPDGRRFIVPVLVDPTAVPGAASAAPQMRYLIHQNWFGELKRLTAAKP
jgi:Tol biopolymer transport system component/tRNA A-37 threonylcarbamoyl transferase component Bud32